MSDKQTCILVLGMHRSGTSALTGVLSSLEVYLGKALLEANFANEKGYFENNSLHLENEKLLAQIGSSWDDMFYDESKLEHVTDFLEFKNCIKKEFEYSNTFAIKDPRLVYLFPIYEKVLKELGIDVKVIIPFRNPIEVASSLNRRDGMSLEKGVLLWAYNVLLAEKFSRGYERVFIEFDKLMSDTSGTIELISSKLNIDLLEKYEKNKKYVDEFLEPSLKHHNIEVDNLSSNTPKIVKDVLSLKDKFNDTKTSEEFDALRYEFFSYQKIFYNDDIVNSINELQIRKVELDKKDEELSQKDEEMSEKNRELSQKNEELAQKDEVVYQKDEALSRKDEELSRKDEELKHKDNVVLDRENIILGKNNEIDQLRDELLLVYTSRSWKITKPLRKLKKLFK